MKKSIMTSPVLHLAADDQPFRVMSDGSGVATGAVLEQLSAEDGKYHPIAFQSKSLFPVKHNYEIHDVEMLAIIQALEEWRHYLEGVRQPFEIWMDYKNLKYFQTAQKLNRRQAEHITLPHLFLSESDQTVGF